MPTINLSALIDIAFILVIFIVLVANFDRIQELKVDLPQVDGQTTAKETPKTARIVIPIAGLVQIEGEDVAWDVLAMRLADLRQSHEGLSIEADGEASVTRALRVLAEAQKQGFADVAFITAPKSQALEAKP